MVSFKERKMILSIVGGLLLFMALLCGTFVFQSASFFDVNGYPFADTMVGSSDFPPMKSQLSSKRLIVERNRFFSTRDSDQQVAHWYQQEGWQDLTSVGMRWEMIPSGTAVDVRHSAIIYSDFWQDVCQFEETCIFVRTTISIDLPDLTLFD